MRQLSSITGIGMMVGLLGWVEVSHATVLPYPEASAGWVIEAADYTGEVKDQIARLEARYTIRVVRDGWTEIPLALQGVTVTDIKLEKRIGEAYLRPQGGSYVLATTQKGTYTVRVKGSSLMVQDSQFEGLQIGIPQATFSAMSLIVPRKDVELRQADQLYVESRPDARHGGVKLMARLGAAHWIDLRWRTKPAAPVQVEPILYGEVATLVTIEERLARVTSIVSYRMAQGETRRLEVHLSPGVNLLNVRGAGIEDWRVTEAEGTKSLMVSLSAALKDTTYQLVMEGEQPIEEGVAAYELPEIRLVGVKQERGHLALAREGSIELTAGEVEGIIRVDVKELPALLQSAVGTPMILAFKYHQHPYHVTVTLTRHQDHPVLAAIAERGELVTVLSRQGELLTRATYLIKANKKQFIEVRLPEDATLWSCLVDGKSVKPVEGEEGKLLVPMDTGADGARAIPVELVYFERRPGLTGIGRLRLAGPVLDVPTTVANWILYAPSEIKFLKMSGNLERGASSFEFLDEPFVQVAAAEPIQVTGATDRVGNVFGLKSRVAKEGRSAQGRRATGSDQYESYDATSSDLAQEPRDEKGKRGFFNAFTEIFAGGGTPSVPSEGKRFEEEAQAFATRLQEAGILPLKIRLPKSGTVYRFNRLMTTEEALRVNATFVHLRLPWVICGAIALLLVAIGGIVSVQLRRRSS